MTREEAEALKLEWALDGFSAQAKADWLDQRDLTKLTVDQAKKEVLFHVAMLTLKERIKNRKKR